MNYLVDTHYLLWSLIEPTRIESRVRVVLESGDHIAYVSAVSFWEISVKYALGKLELSGTMPEDIREAAINSGYQLLDLETAEAITAYQLPLIPKHKDPFDRMLIWQCIHRNLTLLSADARMAHYEEAGLKLWPSTNR